MAGMKLVRSAIAVTASIALLTGCASTPKASPSDTPAAKVYETAPLTGIKFEQGTNANLAGPSVACKIDNLDVARPQLNLNRTDIVFDEMVEGGLTRFVAVWHSDKPDAVGPVRSIRPMDPDIISPLGGIVCYSGGQLKFVKMMQATDVFNANETEEQGKGTFSRDPKREAPAIEQQRQDNDSQCDHDPGIWPEQRTDEFRGDEEDAVHQRAPRRP